jgi:hypothetical protein
VNLRAASPALKLGGLRSMDANEQIVRIWLETQGFLVQEKLKYKITGGRSSGWGDINLLAYHPASNKRVAIDVTAWMTEKITLFYVNPGGDTHKRLSTITSSEARAAIRQAFGVTSDNQYEIWHVVSFISDNQREQVMNECLKYVNKVVDFPEIMRI